LHLTDIASEIRKDLDFLETDAKDVPERQRSMRAVFDQSWRLLSEHEREVFQALSVFRGGFTRRAAQHVTGASLRALKGLADKSLLHRTPLERYELHELLRQYADEKLKGSPGVAKAVRDRHRAFYCTFLRERETDLKGARQQAALAEIEAEIDNARSAWDWAIASKNETALEGAMGSLCLFYEWRARYQEGVGIVR
jgi:predicted ATPase